MKIEHFPEDVIEEYNFSEKVTPDGYLYVEVQKRNVRTSPDGNPRTGALEKASQGKGEPPEQVDTWILEARVAPNLIRLGGR